MAGIKIYVADLAAYNNGELKGKWFDLPVDTDEMFAEVFEPTELDEIGQPLGDWFIADYQSPFEVFEHDNIDRLNKVAEKMEFSSVFDEIVEREFHLETVIPFTKEMGYYDLLDRLVSKDQVISFVKEDVEEGNLHGVRTKLAQIDSTLLNEEYFFMDGYGNFRPVEQDDLDNIIYEVFNALKTDI